MADISATDREDPPIDKVEVPDFQKALTNVNESLSNASSKDVFTCGGEIPVPAEKVGQDSTPVVIGFDVTTEGEASPTLGKVCLPVGQDFDALAPLLGACSPATFGFKDKDVYDETYRKAIKLDESTFSTNFSPSNLGIIKTIEEMLLPSLNGCQRHSIKAELYKLNVSSGPSGKFKGHVDTPRDINQIGSLVVCLPFGHDGGSLVVRHNGQVVTYNWDVASYANVVQWAAFYSDCEHEVLEVTSGHRITLTYNLIAESRNSPHLLDPTKIPLYRSLRNFFKTKHLMMKGGTVGYVYVHAYRHSSSSVGNDKSPNYIDKHSLKGLDKPYFMFSGRLASAPSFRPVMFEDEDEDAEGVEDDAGAEGGENVSCPPVEAEHLEQTFIGRTFVPFRMSSHCYEYDNRARDNYDYLWVSNERKKVLWLNDPNHRNSEAGFGYLTYGNEPGHDLFYTHAAILARVPQGRPQV